MEKMFETTNQYIYINKYTHTYIYHISPSEIRVMFTNLAIDLHRLVEKPEVPSVLQSGVVVHQVW